MKLFSSLFLTSAALLPSVFADIYLHYPPGSNDRLNENNRDRTNGNRLFDSQDNNRGGYLVAQTPLSVYAGSKMAISWTVQHACGSAQDNCNLVLQYLAGDALVRDGQTTNTIPDANGQCANNNCDTDVKYGRHESKAFYDTCLATSRDQGLFTSDQAVQNNIGQTSTRQNPNGNRNGYECPEERDYYPSAIPNAWTDVAVITNNAAMCNTYKTLSQNVAATAQCVGGNAKPIPITQAACQAANGKWTTVAAKNVAAPDCVVNTQYSRDNSLGNTGDTNGTTANYQWTIPQEAIGKNVVFRIRYNISTGEFTDPVSGANKLAIDKSLNQKNANSPSEFPVWSSLKMTRDEQAGTFAAGNNGQAAAAGKVATRGYVLQGNPNVDPFGPLLGIPTATAPAGRVRFQLAVNTAQWGRTFEDRSHVMQVLDPATNADVTAAITAGKSVYNVGVMGHRGNNQQTYPAVELDFTPNNLQTSPGDVVHFQWSGSANNPANNAGPINTGVTKVAAGSDVTNLVALAPAADTTVPGTTMQNNFAVGSVSRMMPAQLTAATPFLGISDITKTTKMAANSGLSFNSGPITLNTEGDFPYMSTIGSIAGVRSQKGLISVVGPQYTAFKQSVKAAIIAAKTPVQTALAPTSSTSYDGQGGETDQQQAQAQAVNGGQVGTQSTPSSSAAGAGSSSSNVPLYAGIACGLIAGVIILGCLIAKCRSQNKPAAAAKAQPGKAQWLNNTQRSATYKQTGSSTKQSQFGTANSNICTASKATTATGYSNQGYKPAQTRQNEYV